MRVATWRAMLNIDLVGTRSAVAVEPVRSDSKTARPSPLAACGNLPCADPFLLWSNTRKEKIVDKEHIKGAADKAKGAVKEAFGKMTDDPSLQVEGKMDKAKGAAREAVGDAKDAMRRATKP